MAIKPTCNPIFGAIPQPDDASPPAPVAGELFQVGFTVDPRTQVGSDPNVTGVNVTVAPDRASTVRDAANVLKAN